MPTYLNNPNAYRSGMSQQITLRILINGKLLQAPISANVSNNSFFHADDWRCQFAMTSQQSLAWLEQQGSLRIEIQVQLNTSPGISPTSLIIGDADRMTVDYDQHTVDLEGRDLSALLIEAQVDPKGYQNAKSSDVATALAKQYGLTPIVTATSLNIGRFDQLEHVENTLTLHERRGSPIAFLVELAKLEGFDVFVSGTSLYFQPAVNLASAPTWLLRASSGTPAAGNWIVNSLHLDHDLQVAKSVQVTVESWNQQTGKLTTGIYSDEPVTTSKSGVEHAHGSLRYSFVRPNLTQAGANNYAKQQHDLIKRHERKLSVTVPDALTLTAHNALELQGTGSGFDIPYYIEKIDRSVSVRGGYVAQISTTSFSTVSAT